MKFAPTLNYLFSVVYILHLLTQIADKQPTQGLNSEKQQNFFTEELMSSKITHRSILNHTVPQKTKQCLSSQCQYPVLM